MISDLLHDLRISIRMLRKRPGFSSIVVLTLALGIGANTAVFSIVNSVLLRPLPFKNPDRLVMIWEKSLPKGVSQEWVSPGNLIDWREQSQSFERIEAFDSIVFTLTGIDEPELIPGSRVSHDLFPLLGITPVLGRTFLAEDEQPGHERVILISYELWQRRFGSDQNLIGKNLILDNKNYTVIGVMPPQLEFPGWLDLTAQKNSAKVEIWTPLTFTPDELQTRGARFVNALGRLKDGVSLGQAQTEMEAIAGQLEQTYQDNEGYTVTITPLQEQAVGSIKISLLILFGAICLVLLIACANVASLLLARAMTRQREIAIRLALGCSRSRLARQLLTESIILSILSGMVGLLIAYWGSRLFVSNIPGGLPRSGEVGIDGQVFAFMLAISILAGVLFGLLPAIQASKPDFNETLKQGGRGAAESLGRNRTRSILVISEITLSLVLLIGASLLIKSFLRLVSTDPGFNPDKIIAMRVSLPRSRYSQAHQRTTFFKQLVDRVKELPGVQSVATTTNLPLSGTNMAFRFSIEGRSAPPTEILLAQYHAISPDYFRTMNIATIEGRDFSDRDTQDAPGVVIINETLARRYFPDQDPIGKRLRITYGKPTDREIIGIVKDLKHKGLESGSEDEVYVPYFQNPWAFMTLVARTTSDPENVAGGLKSTVWELDKDQPIESIKTGEQLFSNSVSRPRFYARLLAIFAALATALATLGIYGLVSYWVTQRTHEFGIRIALGAKREDILTQVVKQGLVLGVIGVAIGITAAFGLTRFMTNMLYGVSVTDPIIFLGISFILIIVTIIASYVPARRATKVDPMVALRYE